MYIYIKSIMLYFLIFTSEENSVKLIKKDNTFDDQRLHFHKDSFRIMQYQNMDYRKFFKFKHLVKYLIKCEECYIIILVHLNMLQ